MVDRYSLSTEQRIKIGTGPDYWSLPYFFVFIFIFFYMNYLVLNMLNYYNMASVKLF